VFAGISPIFFLFRLWTLPIKAESFVFERQTLPIFHGSLAQPILLKISAIVYLYIDYMNPKNQVSISKTKNFVWSAMFIFFRKIFNSA